MEHTIPTTFEWYPDFDNILEQIASTDDVVGIEWTTLRDVIKYKLDKNVSLFLSDAGQPRPGPRSFSPQPLASGGLKLPPFPPRNRDEANIIESNLIESNIIEAPISFMNEQQADGLKRVIFSQLHEFQEYPPFTIQRVCELCLYPQQHYKSVGKYLRAVEKALLVTSTANVFPPLTEKEKNPFLGTTISMGPTSQTAPSTPLFSPIPFLHEDARRSKSRSPPPSPLVLGTGISSIVGVEQKGLGLVDELDDPSPGHLSDHPRPLSATSRPLFGSLEERFVRADGGNEGIGAEQQRQQGDNERNMVLDDADDKENMG